MPTKTRAEFEGQSRAQQLLAAEGAVDHAIRAAKAFDSPNVVALQHAAYALAELRNVAMDIAGYGMIERTEDDTNRCIKQGMGRIFGSLINPYT